MLYTKDELLNAAGYTSIRPAQMTRLFEVIEELKAEQVFQRTDVKSSLFARHRYLASKVREHLNAVGYNLSADTESLIAQVLEVDGKFFDENIKF